MSKVYEKYLELKREEDVRYLFKAGIFYIFIAQDALEMSDLLNLKVTDLNDKVKKCGFPANNITKYINILNENDIKFKIVDENLRKVDSLEKYLDNQKVLGMMKKIEKLNVDELTPKNALELIYDLSKCLKEMDNIG